MKYLLLIGYFFINCVLCSAQNNQQFGIRAATITYVHSGSSYGTSILYFDDFGDRKANQTIIKADSINGTILTRYYEVFINNESISENNLDSDPKNSQAQTSLSNSITTTVFSSDMLNKLAFSENGKCIVAGKTCTKFTNNTDTICLWNGIVLKASMHLSVVTINLEAIEIKLKPPSDTVFHYKTANYNH